VGNAFERAASRTFSVLLRIFSETSRNTESAFVRNGEWRSTMENAAATIPPALAMKSGTNTMSRPAARSLASGVMARLAPSTISQAGVVVMTSVSMLSCSAAGTTISAPTLSSVPSGATG
jgi:hypothetical protein